MVRRARSVPISANVAPVVVPDGAPAWVTPELIALTLKTWQPYYDTLLTPEEACAMILTASELFAVLSRGKQRETVRRLGTGQQPRTGT